MRDALCFTSEEEYLLSCKSETVDEKMAPPPIYEDDPLSLYSY